MAVIVAVLSFKLHCPPLSNPLVVRMFATLLCACAAGLNAFVFAHDVHDQKPLAGPHQSLWYNALPGDGGTQACNNEDESMGKLKHG